MSINIDAPNIDYHSIELATYDMLTIFGRRAIILKIYYGTPQMIPMGVNVLFLDDESRVTFAVKDLVILGVIDD